MKVAVGSDHRGYQVKKMVIKSLKSKGFEYHDFGCMSEESVDYPDVARTVGEAVARGEYDRGILVCGTGIGVCMAANKIHGIRAAMCYDTFCARRSRQHNDANVICLGGEAAMDPVADILDVFLNTEFKGGRHQRRVEKISQLEE